MQKRTVLPGETPGSRILKLSLIVIPSTAKPRDIRSNAEISEQQLWGSGEARCTSESRAWSQTKQVT